MGSVTFVLPDTLNQSYNQTWMNDLVQMHHKLYINLHFHSCNSFFLHAKFYVIMFINKQYMHGWES